MKLFVSYVFQNRKDVYPGFGRMVVEAQGAVVTEQLIDEITKKIQKESDNDNVVILFFRPL